MKSVLAVLLKFGGLVLAVAVGTAFGYAWLSRDFVALSPGLVAGGDSPESADQTSSDDEARIVLDARHRLHRDVLDQLRRECRAQLAVRQGITEAAAAALVLAHWPVVERTSVSDVVRIIKTSGMKPEDRPGLYEAFGRFCAQGVEMTFFGGEGASVHWPPRKPGEPYIEAFFEDEDGNTVAIEGRERD